ncbi:MAG: hypothetical protein ACI4P4_13660 [Faecousia sp.]
MNAEQWMEQAAGSAAVNACIPLGYQPTLPEMYHSEDNWLLRFYYYKISPSPEVLRVGMPAYTITFSLDGQVVSFQKLNTDTGVLLPGGDLEDPSFGERQQVYMARLDAVLCCPDDAAAQALYPLWLEAAPQAIRSELETWTRQTGKE